MKHKELPNPRSPTLSTQAKADKRIPRPSNCFMVYRMAIRDKVIADNPKINSKEISELAGRMWRNEPEYVKDHFRAIAVKLKEEHTNKYPGYSYSPKKRKNRCLYDYYSSCEESSNAEFISNKKKLRRSTTLVSLQQDVPSNNEVVCDNMFTPKSELKEVDKHTYLTYTNQDALNDPYELHNEMPSVIMPLQADIRQLCNTEAVINNQDSTDIDNPFVASHLINTSFDSGSTAKSLSSSPIARSPTSSQYTDPPQVSPYTDSLDYNSLYSYYVFEI